MTVIGLDVGEARIGVAVSDPLKKIAQPRETIKRDEFSVRRLSELVCETGAETVVIGLPLLLDGREGQQARLTREFARELQDVLDVPITFVDERLSTREAEAILARGRVKRARKRSASDRVAAALILRAYLDGL
ncbi:MAG: Holliday junction resolvase RuvX [Candidatus Anoxymicrobium japonicum]|uniref:Putative pre-16S rRNA nuclease n=1 Tax=Candidatus Anoxymicrobium japonicum TaxID=2013648 RepID=A0A2N3G7H0_9ACTN|nr:MAG: Holliday junction resolvase RuvX [Candidatus Anoxymicrobium japonicum]